MAANGTPFTGVLYAGLIATATGIKVIEFNVRFGDPETQVVLPRLQGDLAQVFQQLLTHQQPTLDWQTDGVTLGVVVAAKGYPSQAPAIFSWHQLLVLKRLIVSLALPVWHQQPGA